MDSNTMNCVYVAVHPRMENLVKVGMSSNIKERVSVLNTSVPEDFTVVLIYETELYDELEGLVIQTLKDEELQEGERPTKEFFKCDVGHVKQVIDRIVEKNTGLKGAYLDDKTIQNLLRKTR